MKCPNCGTRISLFKVRSEFRCPSCGGVINSNVRSVEIVTLISVGVVTVLAPTERFSKLGEFLAYVVIAVVGVAIGTLFLRLTVQRKSGTGTHETNSP
jgi:DNA-directed RNA polymerase subunit RPC12/RpoP